MDPVNSLHEMVLAADRLAARRALTLARQFNQTLCVVQDGKVVELSPDAFEAALDALDREDKGSGARKEI